jgi:hypothetical protein
MAISTVMLGLSAIVLIVFYGVGFAWNWNATYILWGIGLEASVMLAITMLFGVFSKPLLVVVFSVGVYLIGHWQDSLAYFSGKSESKAFRVLGEIVGHALPNLEVFNWRNMILVNEKISWVQAGNASLNAVFWILLCLSVAAIIFRRRDFV